MGLFKQYMSRNIIKSNRHIILFFQRYLFPIGAIVFVFIFFGFILRGQREKEINSLEMRLQMQASLLGEKISSKFTIYEMTIALLAQADDSFDKDSSGQPISPDFEHTIQQQLLIQEGLEGVLLFSITGDILYSSYYPECPKISDVNNVIIESHRDQGKEFSISPITRDDGKYLLMSRIIHHQHQDKTDPTILALIIETESFFDSLAISTLSGIIKATLYDANGEVFSLWYNENLDTTSMDFSITHISQLSVFSKIPELGLTNSSIHGGMRILVDKDVYIPLAQISSFPLTVALHVEVPIAMNVYDRSLSTNLVIIFFLLIILLFINHRLNQQRLAKEALGEQMVENLSQQVKERTAKLEKLSNLDPLTGLINRRHFEIFVEKSVEKHNSNETPFSLLAIDLDEFKFVNDTYGHPVGDEVLIHISNTLSKEIGERGIVSRWGGDELMILLPAIKGQIAYDIGASLCKNVEMNMFDNDICCTISIGVAEHIKGEELISLIRRADIALYKAKEEGKNKAVLAYSPFTS